MSDLEAQLAAQHLAAIVESSEDAIISKDLNGIIQSWNASAERLFGYSANEIIGKSIMLLIPADRHHEEALIIGKIKRGERVDHFETVRQAKDGSLIEISLTVSPVKQRDGKVVGASKIVRDIGEKKRADEQLAIQAKRLANLNRVAREISRDLDLERTVQSVTDLATDLSGAKFGSFFYNITDEKGESYLLVSLTGANPESFGNIGMPRNTDVFGPTFRGEGIIRSGDIRKDPRYGKNAPHHGMPRGHLPVVSYLAVPVVSASGFVHGGLFFGHDQPDVFTEECETLVSAIAAQAAIAMDNARLHRATEQEIAQRRRAEAAKDLLVQEIKHRVKNTLGTVQAIVMQTFKGAPASEHEAFVARLQALSNAHDLLTTRNWESANTADIIDAALRPFMGAHKNRIALSGPTVELSPNKALAIAMLLHELGTNAVKYGALSNDSGTVELTWTANGVAGKPALQFQWRESGGPPVSPPTRKGFGSRMIERALQAEQGGARIEFAASGLICRMEIAL